MVFIHVVTAANSETKTRRCYIAGRTESSPGGLSIRADDKSVFLLQDAGGPFYCRSNLKRTERLKEGVKKGNEGIGS